MLDRHEFRDRCYAILQAHTAITHPLVAELVRPVPNRELQALTLRLSVAR
jgi:hypothetical protein